MALPLTCRSPDIGSMNDSHFTTGNMEVATPRVPPAHSACWSPGGPKEEALGPKEEALGARSLHGGGGGWVEGLSAAQPFRPACHSSPCTLGA